MSVTFYISHLLERGAAHGAKHSGLGGNVLRIQNNPIKRDYH